MICMKIKQRHEYSSQQIPTIVRYVANISNSANHDMNIIFVIQFGQLNKNHLTSLVKQF